MHGEIWLSLTGRTYRIAGLLQGAINNAVVSADRSTIQQRTDVDSDMYRRWNPSRTRRFRRREKPDFSGEWTQNRQASTLSPGAAAVQSGVVESSFGRLAG